jgi:hypothetical protein
MQADKLLDGNDIENALQAVGELLAADAHRFGIVVIGGAALSLLGVVDRATRDVDIVAFAKNYGQPENLERPPLPLPPELASAIAQVARDLVALNPADDELAIASRWAHEKNVGIEYQTIIDRVIEHVVKLRK